MEEKIMEEKTVKMDPNMLREGPQRDTTKLSYEELENIAQQLSDQNRQLYNRMQEINADNMFKRLDYLFKVMEFSFKFEDEFVKNCTTEIQDMITLPEEEDLETPEEN